VNGTRLVTGRIVRKLLGDAGEFAFFIATAGSGPENLSRSLIGEGKFLEGYLADLAGSAIVESVTDQVYREVMVYAARNGYEMHQPVQSRLLHLERGGTAKTFLTFLRGHLWSHSQQVIPHVAH
jgi:hypothetical protein